MPPRSNTAILGASILSFLALPPWIAFMERAWPRTIRNALTGAEVSKPVPGEDAFDTDNQILSVGCNRLERWFRRGLHIPVKEDLSVLIQDAEVHGAGMQVD